jgi:hypothetical protein
LSVDRSEVWEWNEMWIDSHSILGLAVIGQAEFPPLLLPPILSLGVSLAAEKYNQATIYALN